MNEGQGTSVNITSTPHQLNVASGSAVRIQQLLAAGNVLSTAGGQQYVITSPVNMTGLTQVIPSGGATLPQGSVARILNISPQQRATVSRGGTIQLSSTGADGRVKLVAINSQARAAAHPTLVTSLASPIRQTTLQRPVTTPTTTTTQQPTLSIRTRKRLYDKISGLSSSTDERPIPTKKNILDTELVNVNNDRTKYAINSSFLFFISSNDTPSEFSTFTSKQLPQQFNNFLKSNKLEDDDDLVSVVTTSENDSEVKASATVVATTPVAAQQQGTSPTSKPVDWRVKASSFGNSVPRQRTPQQPVSTVYDSAIGSQEQILEKVKQEQVIVQRVGELQREGLWSEKRLPKVQEPPRKKAHWDYLLEEMVWLAADFAQERKWKKANAKKCAKMVTKYFQDKEANIKKEQKNQEQNLRKIANFAGRNVKNFWQNVQKLVEYKQTTLLEEKRKKALDQQLSFIVDQTERITSKLTESMNKPGVAIIAGGSDDDYVPDSCSDDEDTIAKEEEEGGDASDNDNEVETLQREGELPLEELLNNLPQEYFDTNDTNFDPGGKDVSDYTAEDSNSDDDEETIIKEETEEGDVDHKEEINELTEEQDIPIEELRARYSGAPPVVDLEDKHDDTDSDDESEEEEDEEEEETDENDESDSEEEDNEIGLKSLIEVKQSETNESLDSNEEANKQINDVSLIAASIQPKGNTLQTTSVVTPIPFLLKHTLREYQHIGLDWLVTMFDRKLNGILADEMGLGKTIQTIALLAHLACEKNNWGPHLIVVPTSVMLNWEMEIKKWCPAFKILTYYGTQKERKQKRVGWTKQNAFHICITSYKLVIQDHQSFRRKKWKYLILDEAQNIKNFKSQRWQLLLNFQTQRRLLLTGTPLQNNLMELWSLMHFLMPNVFQSHREFKEWFSNPVTGMIEGSSEYNENIIKRLHKVLRPFLLRRLKTEVEKQLPKKYEHVVMCRLSKRQRYLYDDFMSRAKTRETLACGNLLSVINVLMQLRKVCNHPNLFEARPIISPFQVEGITYRTASLVYNALQYNPFEHVNLSFYNLLLIMLETLSSYGMYRVKTNRTPKKLIEEIETIQPVVDTRPPIPKSKMGKRCQMRFKRQERRKPTLIENINISNYNYKLGGSPRLLLLTGEKGQEITATIGGTQQRLVPKGGKFIVKQTNDSGIPMSVGLVQTSTGQQMYFQTQKSPVNPVFNGTVLKSNNINIKNEIDVETIQGEVAITTTVPNTVETVTATKQRVTRSSRSGKNQINESSTEFMLPEIEEKMKIRLKNKMELLATVNEVRCSAYPIYGTDLRQAVQIINRCPPKISKQPWAVGGSIYVTNSQKISFWEQTTYLNSFIKSASELVTSLKDVLDRFVLYVPAVVAPRLQCHVSHPLPSVYWKQKREEFTLTKELSPLSTVLHSVASAMCTQFPDPRLIQYDCGKLQVLDTLLRDLKTKQHRVLLFTQMTRMLDVLEAFLNFHGHIYLRLDGSTKVDQRQVLMERFNNDKRIFCFILSTRSGGIGVNLTGADTVIFYDSDWNPTMDAQAQDRCHRIGQTRDVHIYRLVSEMTVEENILKKANQKRLLGDLAIEGGNFTTAYFKSSTIQDLFNVDVNEQDASRRMAEVLRLDRERRETEQLLPSVVEEKTAIGVLENALAEAEDDTDVQAAKTAKAEAAAELAEFDENIPLDESETTSGDVVELSKAEQEVNQLVSQLTAIEKYAMRFVEENDAAWSAEQLAAAAAQIEQQKREWELNQLQAMRAEEERRLQEEELDEDLLTYSREDSNQVWWCEETEEEMPIYCPPTPPQADNDIYIDNSMTMLYESIPMLDTELPPIYQKKDLKRTRVTDITTDGRRTIKMHRRDDTQVTAPRSLFDHPTSAMQKLRRDQKYQKYRGLVKTQTQQIPGTNKTLVSTKADAENMPEWTIHEDQVLLESIEKLQELQLSLENNNPGHTPNWNMVADMVNVISRIHRSPSHCRNRFESVIVPREEGKLQDVNGRKQKKTKGLYKTPLTKSNRLVKTCQLYAQDNNSSFTHVYEQKFDNIAILAKKRKPTVKPLLVNPTLKNPKHAAVLADSGINYDNPLDPVKIASKRAERIAKEKQKLQQSSTAAQPLTPEQLTAQQLLQRQQVAAAVAAAAAKNTQSAPTVIPFVSTTATSHVVSIVTTTTSTATVVSQTQTIVATPQVVTTATLTPQLRQTRPITAIGIQEIVAASQARTGTNSPTTIVSVAGLTQAQLQGRIVTSNLTAAPVTSSPTTVKGTMIPTTTVTKNLNPAQIHYYRQQALLKQQQQFRLTSRDQHLKVIQAQPANQATVSAIQQQKATAVATVSTVQPVSPPQQKTSQYLKQNPSTVPKRPEDIALMKQTLQRQQRPTTTQQPAITAQILAQMPATSQGQVATLVKTSASGVTGISMPQVKATINSQIKTTTGTTQIRQIGITNYQQLLTKQGRVQTKVAQIAKPGLPTQLIVQSQGGKAVPSIAVHNIQQVLKNQQHITVSSGQVIQQGNQVVVAKAPQLGTGNVQTRIIPVSGSQSGRQTIQVLPGTAIRAVQNIQVSSTLANALTGSIKVTPASSQQAFISQVTAMPNIVRQAGVNPVRIQTSSSQSGTPLMAVTVQQGSVQQVRTTQQSQDNPNQS